MSLSINLSPGLLLFLRFPLPGYSMPMGINLSSALPLFLPDQRRVNLLVIPKSTVLLKTIKFGFYLSQIFFCLWYLTKTLDNSSILI